MVATAVARCGCYAVRVGMTWCVWVRVEAKLAFAKGLEKTIEYEDVSLRQDDISDTFSVVVL